MMRGLRRLGTLGLVVLGVIAGIALLILLYVAFMLLTGPVVALLFYLWEMAPSLLLSPYLLAPGLVVLVVTALAAAYGAVARREISPAAVDAGCLLPFMVVPTVLVHLLPALLVVLVVQEVWLALPIDWKDPAEVALRTFLPAAKIGVLFSYAGNFADLASLRGTPPLRRHAAEFVASLLPAYYAMLAVAAGLGALLGSLLAPPFRPRIPLHRLWTPPRIAPDPLINTGLLVLLVVGAVVVSHGLRRNRAAAGRPAGD